MKKYNKKFQIGLWISFFGAIIMGTIFLSVAIHLFLIKKLIWLAIILVILFSTNIVNIILSVEIFNNYNVKVAKIVAISVFAISTGGILGIISGVLLLSERKENALN